VTPCKSVPENFSGLNAFAKTVQRGLLRRIEIEFEARRPRLAARDSEGCRLFDDFDQTGA